MSSTKVVHGDIGQLEEQPGPLLPLLFLLHSVPPPGPVRWVDRAQDQSVKLIPSQRLFSVTLQLCHHLLHGAAASGYPIVDLREEGSPRPHGRQLLVLQHDVVVPVQLHPRHQDLSAGCKQQYVSKKVDLQDRKVRLTFWRKYLEQEVCIGDIFLKSLIFSWSHPLIEKTMSVWNAADARSSVPSYTGMCKHPKTRFHFYTRPLEVKEVILTWQHLLKQQVQDDTRTDSEMHFCSVGPKLLITAFFSPQLFSAFSAVSARNGTKSTFTFFQLGKRDQWPTGCTAEQAK